jgi:hypothetical protein
MAKLFWGRGGVRLKQHIRFPLFERLFHRISVLRGASRWGGGGGMLYVSGALWRTYTLFYPHREEELLWLSGKETEN